MSKLLIALATTVALVGPAAVTPAAAQPTMPAEFRGEWCRVDRGDFYVPRKQASANCAPVTMSSSPDYTVNLTANEIEFEDGACKLTSIKNKIVPNVGDGNVVHGKVNLPTGVFTCDGVRRVFFFSNGKGPLRWKERRFFLED